MGAAALLIAAYTLFRILWPLRWSLASTWAVVELIFFVLYWRPRYAELNEQPATHEPANLEATAMKTFQRFLRFCKELPAGNIDYEAYYSGWFRGAPFDQIKRGELRGRGSSSSEQGQQQWRQQQQGMRCCGTVVGLTRAPHGLTC